MGTLVVHAPDGPTGSRRVTPARAPAVLAGVRIGVLDNRKPNARLLLTTVAERLAVRTGARIALVTEKANAAVQAEADVVERLRVEVDVVLTGSGD